MNPRLKRKVVLAFIISTLVILLVTTFKLESWVKDSVNNQINEIKGYSGQVSHVDFNPAKGKLMN